MSKYLKEQRELLGRELNYIADTIKIKASYLKAIEEEDFSKLPAEVYTKGYLREYAKFLGVSPDAAIMSYNAYLEKLKGIDGEKSKENLFHASLNTAPKIAMIKRLLLGFSLSIAGIILYLLIVPSSPQKVETDAQVGTPLTNPPISQEITLEKEQLVNHDVIANIHDDKNKIAQKRHMLNITATDRTWIQIIIDDIDKKEVLLNAGESVNYEANQSINVLIGNASGVKLKFNGEEFENLGNKGQVIRLSFPYIKKDDSTKKINNPESSSYQSSNIANSYAYNQ